MVARADILAGRAVIFVNIQDTVEKQLRSIRSKLRMFTAGVSELGGDLFRGGLAGSVATIFPVKEFVNFQDQMLFLQTKVQATDAAMKPLEKTIRTLGMSTSFSSKEVAQAATMFAQAGFSIVEIQDSLQSALDLSRGSQVDLTTSTTILANALRTFQKDASNAALFASKFVTTARLGTLDIVDLGESLKYSSGTFANFGLELDDVLGMITTLANSGLKASLAGTSLNTAFLNLSSTAAELKEILGVELMDEDFRNPLQALKKLEEGLKKFSKIEQAGILQGLVNIRGGRAIQGLLLQGLDKLEENIRIIKNSTDEARTSAIKLDSQLGGVGRRALSAFQEFNIAAGATTEGPLTQFGERVAAVFNNLSRLAEKNPKVTQTLMAIPPAALAAGVALLTLTTIAGKLAMLITPVMMLNTAIFSLAANIAGMNVKAFKDIGMFLGTPLVKARKHFAELDKLEKATQKKRVAYFAGETKKRLEALRKAERVASDFRQSSWLTREYNVLSMLEPMLARIVSMYSRLATVMGRLSGSPFTIPSGSMAGVGAGMNRGWRGSYGFPGFSGKGLGYDPRVFAPTAAQNIPDAPAEKITKALNRVGGLILRPFRDLPEQQTKQTAKGFDRLGRRFVATFQTRLTSPIAGFLNYFGKGITKEVFRGFTIVAQSPRLLTDNRRGLITTEQVRALSVQQRAAATTQTTQRLLTGSIRSLSTAIRRTATVSPARLGGPTPPSQRFLGGPGGQIIEGRVRAGGQIGAARQFGQGVTQQLSAAGKAGRALRMLIIGIGTSIQNFLGKTGTLAVKGFNFAFEGTFKIVKGVASLFKSLSVAVLSVNWLRGIIVPAKVAWSALKGLFTVLNLIRRTLFSLSGWLMIVEILILFGDKIPIVKDALEGLGNAFKALFGGIGETLKNLVPSFQLIGRGLSDIFGGNIERGIIRIKQALSDIGNVISTGLTAAWAKAMSHIKPGLDILSEGFDVLLSTFNLIIDGFENLFGAAFKSGEIIITGDSGFLDKLKQLFSLENRQQIYTMIGGFISGIFTQLLKGLEELSKAILELKSVFLSVGGYFQLGISYLLEAIASLPFRISGLSDKQQQRMFINALKLRNESADSLKGAKAAIDEAGLKIDTEFNSRLEKLSKGLTDFLEDLPGKEEEEADSLPGKGAGPAKVLSVKERAEAEIAARKAQREAQAKALAEGGKAAAAQRKADEAAASARNREIVASIIDGDIFKKGAWPAVGKILGAAMKQPLMDIGEENFTTAQQIEDSLKGTRQGRRVLEKIAKEVDVEDPMEWLRESGLLTEQEAWTKHLATLPQTEATAADMRRNMASKMFDQFNMAQAKEGDGTIWAGYDAEESNKKLRKSVQSLLKTTPEDIKEGAKNLWSGIKSTFGFGDGLDKAVAPQAAQIAPIASSIGKAIVGDFESTRGNLAQMVPKMEQLQSKANEYLEGIEEEVTTLNRTANPFVFKS